MRKRRLRAHRKVRPIMAVKVNDFGVHSLNADSLQEEESLV